MKDRRPGLALELLDMMPSRGVAPDTVLYNAAMKAAASAGHPDQALLLMDRLLSASDQTHDHTASGTDLHILVPTPDEYSFAIAMDAAKANHSQGHALGLLREAEARGFSSSPAVTVAAAAACASSGQYAPVMEMIKKLAADGHQPSRELLNTAMIACTNGGQWQYAFDLFVQTCKHGPLPDRYTYNALLAACSRSVGYWSPLSGDGHAEGGSETELVAAEAGPDLQRLLGILNSDGPINRTIGILQVMKEQGGALTPDLVSYNTSLAACMRVGGEAGLSTSRKLLEALRQDGLIPDLITYSTAITVAGCSADVEAANKRQGSKNTKAKKGVDDAKIPLICLDPNLVLALVDEALNHKIELTSSIFDNALAAAGQLGNLDKQMELKT
jgi:hypothetical protein